MAIRKYRYSGCFFCRNSDEVGFVAAMKMLYLVIYSSKLQVASAKYDLVSRCFPPTFHGKCHTCNITSCQVAYYNFSTAVVVS